MPMGKKQRDCTGCGAPVGYLGREYCCLCSAEIRHLDLSGLRWQIVDAATVVVGVVVEVITG